MTLCLELEPGLDKFQRTECLASVEAFTVWRALMREENMEYKKPPAAGDCVGNRPTAKLISCLQPDRRVEVEVSGTR